MFVQHIVEPVYILHYDRHVAVSELPSVYFERKSGAKSITHFQAITFSPPEMKETFNRCPTIPKKYENTQWFLLNIRNFEICVTNGIF